MAYAPPEWAGSAYPSLPPQRRERVLLRFGNAWTLNWLHLDMALIALWFIVTAAQFQYDELLLYPLALYFTGMFFWRKDVTWPIFQRGALLILLPCWWMASAIWAPDSVHAFRSGLQSLLTILICMFIAARLTHRQLLAIVIIAMTVTALRCLPRSLWDFSVGYPSRGVLAHKNSLGIMMSVSVAAALAVAIAPGVNRLMRLMALAAVPLSLFLIFASQSATGILLAVGMCGIILAARVYLGPENNFTLSRLILAAATLGAISVAMIFAFNLMQEDPVDLVLAAVGKDRSLTGRTDLWAIGMEQLAENPYLGVGPGGFWRYQESALVRQIFHDYHLMWRSSFFFHNSWLEIGVAFGWFGIIMAIAATSWTLIVLARRAIKFGSVEDWTFFAIGIGILLRTFVESDLFAAFVMLHMMFWSAALMRHRRLPSRYSPSPSVAPLLERN